MRGAGEHPERVLWLRGEQIGLRFDDGWPAHPGLLAQVLDTPRVDAWSGVTIGRQEPFDTLQLWLATALDGFCLLTVNRDLDSEPLSPVSRIASPAVAEGASFAYLASRRLDETTVEFGASAFGPGACVLAESMTEQVRMWDRAYRSGPGPVIAAYPAGTPDGRMPDGLVIDKRHVRVTVSWPRAGLLAVGQAVQHHTPQLGE
jgi:protein-L-isoaspartate(D-aspartate) O-methyltransferase